MCTLKCTRQFPPQNAHLLGGEARLLLFEKDYCRVSMILCWQACREGSRFLQKARCGGEEDG